MVKLNLLTKKESSDFLRVKEWEFHAYYEKYTEKYFMPEYGGYLYTLNSLKKAFMYVRMYRHLEYEMPTCRLHGLKCNSNLKSFYLGNEDKIVEININNTKPAYKFLSQKLFAIYILIKEEEVVYIGKSTTIYNRILNHKASDKDFDKVHVLIYKTYLDYHRSEALLINKFDPKYNSYLKIKK